LPVTPDGDDEVLEIRPSELAPVLPIGPRPRTQRGPDARRRSRAKEAPSTLWYGDNLRVLRENVADESVDLIYLDPPFNSNRTYNVLFRSPTGQDASAQIKAFDDTWHWGQATAAALHEIHLTAPLAVSQFLQTLCTALKESDLTAYLVMMTQRLLELHRVLKPTGSVYLHCDPTASHYLKVLMDMIFGADKFRSEIIWKRSQSHNSAKRYGPVHDTILYYAKSKTPVWTDLRVPLSQEYQTSHYSNVENGRRYKRQDITGPGIRRGETGRPWRGIDPTAKGRHWMRPPSNLDVLDAEGKIYWPAKLGAWPYLKLFLDEAKGAPLQDVWIDIDPVNPVARERLGYPTQKPLALLERIVQASSNPGDVVLDPFCGCGTAVVAAEKLNRRWMGIDITSIAVGIIENRLDDLFENAEFQVNGLPEGLDDAIALAERDEYQFQWWAITRLHAFPWTGKRKKGPDTGVDGVFTFFDDPTDTPKRCIVSVKSGRNVGPADVRDLLGTVQSNDAAAGALVVRDQSVITAGMRQAAARAGMYLSPLGHHYPKIQIFSSEDLVANRMLDLPTQEGMRRRANRIAAQRTAQPGLWAE
jgi:adenine specific DNA methylase Mod